MQLNFSVFYENYLHIKNSGKRKNIFKNTTTLEIILKPEGRSFILAKATNKTTKSKVSYENEIF